MNTFKTRQLYEAYCSQGQGGRTAFVNQTRHWLGLSDKDGNDYKDQAGNRKLGERSMRADQFSLAELAEGIIGPSWKNVFDPNQPGRMFQALTASSVIATQYGTGDRRAMLESVGVGLDPSQFQDINTWTAVAGGLIEVKFLEGWDNPAFIADELMPAENTRMLGGQKVIGLGRIGNLAAERKPGEATQRAGFSERYVQTPATRENALAVDITNEAVLTDLTGDMLRKAEEVGYWLSWAKELNCIDLFIGVTNTYTYNGTTYNTYLSSGNWVNTLSNELLTWEQVEQVILKFADMTDQETGTRVAIQPDTVLVMPGKVATANLIFEADRTGFRNSLGSTQATAPVLSVRETPGNPYQGRFEVLSSVLIYQRATDASGLNLSTSNATKYWWAFEKGKPFKYMQVFPLTVTPAPPNSYDMIDRNIVASYFARERGIPSVWEPRRVVRSTN